MSHWQLAKSGPLMIVALTTDKNEERRSVEHDVVLGRGGPTGGAKS
jgi:hypothetical protein